jgi:ABC-2 type transport system permease protein
MPYGFTTIYWRDMIRFVRFKTLLFASLLQPALWLAFFGIAMASNFDRLLAGVPIPPGVHVIGYLTFMGAGIIAMTTLFTSLFGGIVILFDKNWGLMREILASPMDRNHIIFGIGLSGVTKSFIQAIIIMVFGILLGAGFFQGYTLMETAVSVLGILAFVAMFALGFLFLSAAIAISMESPEGLQGVITLLTMPIFFASNALYPIDAFPEFLKVMSLYNPMTYLINGIRYFAIGPDFMAIGKHYMYTQGDIVVSYLGLVVFTVLMLVLAWWRFQKAVVT